MDRKWRALIIVCVAIFMLLLDITVVNVALPDIQRELHTSFTDLQWVVDAYALLLTTCMLNAGTLGALLGGKGFFITGVVLFTAASAACGSATSPLFLNLARGAQGIGGAIMFSVSLAILSQEFHGRERGTAFGIWGATIGAAVAIGPLVGGALTTWAGWRWIFFVNLPIGALCVVGALAYLHESRDEEHRGFDLLGLALSRGWPGRLWWGGGARWAGPAFSLEEGDRRAGRGPAPRRASRVGAFGTGMVNPPLATTAVGVVEPRRAGMASGVNNTFRQVGIATGIAGLGALFQSRIQSKLHAPAALAKVVASGHFPGSDTLRAAQLYRSAFLSGMNEILLFAAL